MLNFLRKYSRLIAVALVVLALVLVSLIKGNQSNKPNTPSKNSVAAENCGPYRNDKIVTIGNNKIVAEATKKLSELEKGLGGRPCIPANRGMLFGFTKAGSYPFWMKDMKFPIDIIWISTDHRAVVIAKDIQPNTYPHQIHNTIPAQYVLELKANQSDVLNITQGTVINF